jgi:photosystem II stability/assembly factor-like uncharacterized protein
MFARSVRVALALAALVLAPTTAAQAASLWTPVSTPTTHTISAIAYPSASEVVFVTTAGDVFHGAALGPYSASSVSPSNPSGFTDLAMSADGTKGVAVGPSGLIYRSTDGGATWSQVTGTMEYTGSTCPGAPNPVTLGALTDDLYSVQFADGSTVYVTGKNHDVLKSTNGGASFSEVNRQADGSCRITVNDDLTDTAWIDANHGFFISRYFGDYFATIDGLTTPIASRRGEAVNAFTGAVEVAINPSDSTHAWAVTSGGVGGLSFQATTDGGTTWADPTYDGHNNALNDISFGGGTVITVGNGGDIYTSPDGKNFTRQVADPPNNTNDWHADAVLDASHAVVAGANGVLLFTSRANQLPDTTPPTGTISGPTSLAVGQFGTYVAHVSDNPGGSGIDTSSLVWSTSGQANQTGGTASFAFSTAGAHSITLTFRDLAGNSGNATITVHVSTPAPSGSNPTTRSTGGGIVTIFQRVTITGRKGRFIPVGISCKHARKFVITVLTIKGHHHRAVAYATCKKGHKTVKVFLAKSVKTGTYLLVVRVFTIGGHGLGVKITVAFILV